MANLFAAVRRQCIATAPPDHKFLAKFKHWFDSKIVNEMVDLLSDFHYSVEVHYNHLSKHQQDNMDKLDPKELNTRCCCIHCKGEKQLVEVDDHGNITYPKTRSISAMCEEHKAVMGPIVYALEQYFKQFKGYGGGKDWQSTCQWINYCEHRGLTKVIQSDISGMDRSVTYEIKQIVGHAVYSLVEPYVKHVDQDTWRTHAYARFTKINANYYDQKEFRTLGSCIMEGEVFSGSSDTTFFNTLVTACFQRYVMEVELGIDDDDYDITAKGDDCVVVCQTSVDNKDIRAAYDKVYYRASLLKGTYASVVASHGSGMVLKFLSISEHLDDIDFCSTACYKCDNCGYKMTRRLDRFLYLTPWSDSIKNLKRPQQLAYLQNLYDANNCWMRGLPIFRALNEHLKTGHKNQYTMVGGRRKTLPLTKEDTLWFEKMFDVSQTKRHAALIQKFGKDAAYSMVSQNSEPKTCCAEAYAKWLYFKCGLSRDMIASIERTLFVRAPVIYCPLLEYGLKKHEQYKNKLLIN